MKLIIILPFLLLSADHWPYLSDWVSFGSRDLVFFGLTSGKRALHFCQLWVVTRYHYTPFLIYPFLINLCQLLIRVNPIQPEDDFEYGYLNSVLESLLKPKNVEKFDERVNFSLAVRQRFQKGNISIDTQIYLSVIYVKICLTRAQTVCFGYLSPYTFKHNFIFLNI